MKTFYFGSLLHITIYIDIKHTVRNSEAHHLITIYRARPPAIMGEKIYMLGFNDMMKYTAGENDYETGSYEIIDKTGCGIQTKELRDEDKWIVVADSYLKGTN